MRVRGRRGQARRAPSAYIRIERTHGEASPYRLQVTERVLDDKDEPANGWKSAVPLVLDTKHRVSERR